MKEIWLAVVGFEGLYEVSSEGRVRSLNRITAQLSAVGKMHNRRYIGRILKPAITRTPPYPRVVLSRNGKRFDRIVHKLVSDSFFGPCPPGLECCHNDGNRLNNRIENLRYDTHAANEADRRAHGNLLCGSRHGMAKLTEADIPKIRLLAASKTHREIGRQFGVCRVTIDSIVKRETWRHVAEVA